MDADRARRTTTVLAIAVWLGLTHPRVCEARPIDDGRRISSLGMFLDHREVNRIGLFRIEEAITTECNVYVARVVDAIHGLKNGERIIFAERIERPSLFRKDVNLPDPESWPYPKFSVGKEYFIVVVRTDDLLDPHVRALGFTEPIACAFTSKVIRTDLWKIHEILPQIRQYAAARHLPEKQRPAAMRTWALANLDTRHELLRKILHYDLAYYPGYYPGASKQEATRLAEYSDVVLPKDLRFSILVNLALHTDHPMDFWFLRAVSRGAPGKIDPGDLSQVFAFNDSLYDAARKLSIDTFWPILERKTTIVSPWVEAFAQKADPRLLPIILRHLEPGKAHSSATESLTYYRGKPEAARALIDLVRRTGDLGDDKNAQKRVYQALHLIGTPDAVEEAMRLRKAKNLPLTWEGSTSLDMEVVGRLRKANNLE